MLACCLCSAVLPVDAAEIDADTAAKVKAGYLLNFARYTQWPASAFERPDSPIVLTVVGRCDLDAVLPEVVARAEPVDGRRIELHLVEPAGDDAAAEAQLKDTLDHSHLVYVCALSPDRLHAILDRCSRSKVLTVGDSPGFAAAGGMLGFVLHGDRILFEANPGVIQQAQVSVSAKVLKLARIVGEGGTP